MLVFQHCGFLIFTYAGFVRNTVKFTLRLLINVGFAQFHQFLLP